MPPEPTRRRVLVIGATGTIGSAVADALVARGHAVVRASRSGQGPRVDIADPASVEALLATAGPLDAVVCCAASGAMAPLDTPSDAEFLTGLDTKLLGQVALVRRAVGALADGGSITLTSGRIPDDLAGASLGHLINAGLDAFVRAASAELPRGLRLNVVSPGWVAETLAAIGLDPAGGTPAAEVAARYAEAVEGDANGRTLLVG
ncbi:short chain dehydrogenase [Streptomyces sp. PT12]|uniref:short chain dehydrogenase n=1 Tax=Streptomyces sp. PT12 TaxID=1510197 RepID=UPI000DE2E64E|nr:short chain dehydrogenase [Streptomyces sp. PT12]RBM04545.1 short chain dehydrogenase [Streptomyces sp. PT12]